MRTLCSYPLFVVCFLFVSVLSAQSSISFSMATLDESSSLADPVYLPSLSTTVAPTPSNKPLFRALPVLAEGQEAIAHFLRETITYPEVAIENAIEGIVVIAIKVEADGTISNVKVTEPLFAPIDQLVLANAKKLPRLAPAIFNGQAVTKELLIPVQFSLR